jgi:hypothetical protein
VISNRALDEAQGLINYFYHLDDQDDEIGYDVNSRYFRASVYRMIVMELHLAIESVLQDVLFNTLPQRRVFSVQQNRSYVESLSFSAATELAARLGVLNRRGYDELRRFNTIRNRCAHDWILGQFKMSKGVRSVNRRRQYRVEFNGKDLFKPDTFKHEFLPHYGDLYMELFAVAFDLRHKRQYTYPSDENTRKRAVRARTAR